MLCFSLCVFVKSVIRITGKIAPVYVVLQYCLSSCTTHNGCSQFKVSCNLSTPCTAALADMLLYRRIDSPEFCKFNACMFQFALLYTPKCTLFSFSYSFDPSPTITDSLAVPASSCLVYTYSCIPLVYSWSRTIFFIKCAVIAVKLYVAICNVNTYYTCI